MNDLRAFIERYAAGHAGAMADMLKILVSFQSGTANKTGVDALARYLEDMLRRQGLRTSLEPRRDSGDILMAELPSSIDAPKRIILSGHLDTVFPADTPFNAMRCAGTLATGPGVIDMKGGLVVGIYAMLALRDAGRADLPLRFLFSPDEEVSSRNMRSRLLREREEAAFALVFECAGPGNELVRTRKGKLSLDARFRGRAGHAAFAAAEKPSAILDLAGKIPLLEALNSPHPADGASVSVNVGRIFGGIGRNTVAEEAGLEMEIRSGDSESLRRTGEKARQILLRALLPGVETRISNEVSAPPVAKECTAGLYVLAASLAAELDQPVGEDFRPGASEAGWFSQIGIPVLDGLGPRGGKDHSAEEFIELDSLRERLILTALLLPRAWEAWRKGDLPRVEQGRI